MGGGSGVGGKGRKRDGQDGRKAQRVFRWIDGGKEREGAREEGTEGQRDRGMEWGSEAERRNGARLCFHSLDGGRTAN